jgi:AraC-like DNA-binding protein
VESPNPNADPQMARYARQLIDTSIGSETVSMTGQVRELVVTLLSTGKCTLDLVAQHLGVDRRTVHRHLASEDQRFAEIVDAVRLEIAARYMKDPKRTLAEVSSLLGFSAPSGFSRWYRRQFNDTASRRRATPRAQ